MIHRSILAAIAVACIIGAAVTVHAVPTDPADPGDGEKFRRLSVNDGLSQNSVFRILQDRDGFIWIATQDGLNRFDGYDFEVFKHDPDDPNSLSENTITALYEDREGMLWIGTKQSGLNRFDPTVRSFKHYRHDPEDERSIRPSMIMAIAEDSRGDIWVGTHLGLSRLDQEAGYFVHYAKDPERPGSIGADFVTAILVDRSETMWVGTWDGGLNRYIPERDAFEVISYDPVNQAGLPDPRVTALYEDQSGELWVGTVNGLSRFDRATRTFETFGHVAGTPEGLTSGEITAITEDGSGAMWIGTWEDGLNRWNPDRTSFKHFKHDPYDSESLSDNNVTSILEDRSGVIWAGTKLGGINQMDRHRVQFAHLNSNPRDDNSLSENTVWSIAEGADGNVWIGTHSQGLVRYNLETDTYERIPAGDGRPGSIRGGYVRAVLEDSKGRLWLSTNEGILNYRSGEGVTRHFKPGSEDASGPSSNWLSSILEDSRGVLWFGGNQGIDRYDDVKGTFKPLFQDEWSRLDGPATSVLTMFEDSHGHLWAGTHDGLVRFDVESGRFERFVHDPGDPTSISNSIVYSVTEDSRGFIWVGTFGGGLNRFDPESGSFRRWTEQNSLLPTNTVFGVLPDGAGYLWLSTHRGLTRFDPVTETFRVYGAHHRVQSPEFNSGAFHRGLYTGKLYFGGLNGVNIVDPDDTRENPNPPEVKVTDVRLHSRSLESTPQTVRLAHAVTAGEVRLDHNQNDLWIDYVGLHYSLPGENQYAYMLENYDDNWRYVGTTRGASYTNLDPGSYRFRVKAASADGVWNDEGATLEIRIDPPWWKTTVAYVIYLAMLVMGVFLVDNVQRRRLIQQERERSAIREARLRARALEVQNERQARELEEARELQLSMLPREVPDHPSVEIDAYMKTATEVGGDYYDFHVSDEGVLTAAIGDATDHGARAGTMVTAVKSLFNILVEEDDLERVISRATDALRRMRLGQLYMALALAKLKGPRMRIAGAGMPPALIHRAATGTIEEVSLSGMPLGSTLDYPYSVSEVMLRPGDTILLMSDGLAERFDDSGEMFGYDRARDAFAGVATKPPSEIIEHLVRISDDWAQNGAPTDDMTFVVMKAKADIPSAIDSDTDSTNHLH